MKLLGKLESLPPPEMVLRFIGEVRLGLLPAVSEEFLEEIDADVGKFLFSDALDERTWIYETFLELGSMRITFHKTARGETAVAEDRADEKALFEDTICEFKVSNGRLRETDVVEHDVINAESPRVWTL